MDKTCSKCGAVKPISEFKPGRVCKECANARQREFRKRDKNAHTLRYEKTKRGFLMRLYRNMQSRISGVQKQKFHLYSGKSLAISREQFYEWAYTHPSFHELFAAWEISGYARQYTPSVDRVDSSLGYEIGNMEWVTHSENSRRGSLSQWRSRYANQIAA